MVGAIVQARMSSSRLPGKVLKEVLGRPLLWYQIQRLNNSRELDTIIIATTTNNNDKKIVEFAVDNKIKYYCGDEDDVLDRYYQAASTYKLDYIVRITADCPMIDPEVVDKVVSVYLSNKDTYDYVSNAHPPTYPDGLDTEVFSFRILETAWREAEKRYEREHVTPYIWEQPERYSIYNVANEKDFSELRWTVDEERDYKFVKSIFEELYPEKEVFLMADIIDLLLRSPQLLDINRGINRNEGFNKIID